MFREEKEEQSRQSTAAKGAAKEGKCSGSLQCERHHRGTERAAAFCSFREQRALGQIRTATEKYSKRAVPCLNKFVLI